MADDKKKKKAADERQQAQSDKYQEEREELLRRAKENSSTQLQFDLSTGALKVVDELRQLIGQAFENPEDKYQAYYYGIRRVLMQYLPAGPGFKDARQLIYDEKNVFLNMGKKKSDNDGIRKSDGRMTYQPVMNEIVDLIIQWVAETRNPFKLYNMLYDLNEKHGYGHEAYDGTSLNFARAMRSLRDGEE